MTRYRDGYVDDYEYSKTPQAKYDKANTTFISLRVDLKEDADIVAALEGKAKQTEVKRLVRLGMGRIRHDAKRAKEREEAARLALEKESSANSDAE